MFRNKSLTSRSFRRSVFSLSPDLDFFLSAGSVAAEYMFAGQAFCLRKSRKDPQEKLRPRLRAVATGRVHVRKLIRNSGGGKSKRRTRRQNYQALIAKDVRDNAMLDRLSIADGKGRGNARNATATKPHNDREALKNNPKNDDASSAQRCIAAKESM